MRNKIMKKIIFINIKIILIKMSKLILKPGNGINFPKYGDYVKLNILIKTKNEEILFDSKVSKNVVIRIGNSTFLDQISGLIDEMSLFEKCSIEFNKENIAEYKECSLTEELIDLIKNKEKIFFEIEIIEISLIKIG